jgi:predicted transcriptional regulator
MTDRAIKKKAPGGTPVVVRFPPALVKKLDKLAAQSGRSRSSEVRQRVLSTMKEQA